MCSDHGTRFWATCLEVEVRKSISRRREKKSLARVRKWEFQIEHVMGILSEEKKFKKKIDNITGTIFLCQIYMIFPSRQNTQETKLSRVQSSEAGLSYFHSKSVNGTYCKKRHCQRSRDNFSFLHGVKIEKFYSHYSL